LSLLLRVKVIHDIFNDFKEIQKNATNADSQEKKASIPPSSSTGTGGDPRHRPHPTHKSLSHRNTGTKGKVESEDGGGNGDIQRKAATAVGTEKHAENLKQDHARAPAPPLKRGGTNRRVSMQMSLMMAPKAQSPKHRKRKPSTIQTSSKDVLKGSRSHSIYEKSPFGTPALRKASTFHHSGAPNTPGDVNRKVSFSPFRNPEDGFSQRGPRSISEVRASIANLGSTNTSKAKYPKGPKNYATAGTLASLRFPPKSGHPNVDFVAAAIYHDSDRESDAGTAVSYDDLSNHAMFNTDVTHDATLVPALLQQFAVANVPLLKFEKATIGGVATQPGKREFQSKDMMVEAKRYCDTTDAAWARGGDRYRKGYDKAKSEIATKGEDVDRANGMRGREEFGTVEHIPSRPQSAGSNSTTRRKDHIKQSRPLTARATAKKIRIEAIKETRGWGNKWDENQQLLATRLEDDLQFLDRHRPHTYKTNFVAYGMEKSKFLEVNIMKDMKCMRLEAEKAMLEKHVASCEKISKVLTCWASRKEQITSYERSILSTLQNFVNEDIVMNDRTFYLLLEHLDPDAFRVYTVHVLLDFIRRITDVPLAGYLAWLEERKLPLPQKARQQQRSAFTAGLKWKTKSGKKGAAE
jgi:hypothetical protein